MAKARHAALLALLTVIPLATVGCSSGGGGSSEDPSLFNAPKLYAEAADPKGDGRAQCRNVALGYVGTVNGVNAALGQNIVRGAELAVKLHNQANADCQIELKQFETEGKPELTAGVVNQVVADSKVLGVVGTSFSGEAKVAGGLFNQAKLVQITPSATNPSLADNGWETFFRALASDAAQGPAAAKLMTVKLESQRICVVSDDSPYGADLGKAVIDALGDKAICTAKVTQGQTEFASVIDKMANAKPDTIFYSGYYPEAGPLAQQLDAAGVTVKFVGPDGIKNDEFLQAAGNAASRSFFTCPCVPETNFKDFTTAYQKLEGQAPGTYAVEAYDAMTILIAGIDKGITDRQGLLDFVKTYTGQGLTKRFKWAEKGELIETPVWAYKVENGKIVNYGQIS